MGCYGTELGYCWALLSLRIVPVMESSRALILLKLVETEAWHPTASYRFTAADDGCSCFHHPPLPGRWGRATRGRSDGLKVAKSCSAACSVQLAKDAKTPPSAVGCFFGPHPPFLSAANMPLQAPPVPIQNAPLLGTARWRTAGIPHHLPLTTPLHAAVPASQSAANSGCSLPACPLPSRAWAMLKSVL